MSTVVVVAGLSVMAVVYFGRFVIDGGIENFCIALLLLALATNTAECHKWRTRAQQHRCPPQITTDQLFEARNRLWDERGPK